MEDIERIEKTKSGAKWSFFGQLISQGANIIFAVLLTRLLSPDVFGLIAMVAVFSGLLGVVKDFGINSALIFKKNITNEVLDTAFWAQVIIGVVLAAVLFLSRNYIAFFYKKPDLEEIIFYLSFVFIFDSFGSVHAALLRKKMLFKRIFIIETIGAIVSGLISLILALNSFGVWSLVVKNVSLSIIQSFLFGLAVDWKPSIRFYRHILYELLRYGMPLSGNQLSVYLMRNVDNLLVGKFVGADALGIYNRAYSLMMIPMKQIVGIYYSVLFPSFSLINDDNDILRRNWMKIMRLSTFLILPASSMMFLLSGDFVHIVLGSKWLGVIPVLKYLSCAAAVQTICEVSYIFIAKGKTKNLFIMNICINCMLLLSIVVGIPNGIESVALCYSIASVVFIPLPVWFFTAKLIGGTMRDVIRGLLKIFIMNTCTLIVFLILMEYIKFSSIINLILIPVSYFVTYLFFLFLANEKIYRELYELVRLRK